MRLPDQAALYGVLQTIRRLGLRLLAVETDEDDGSSSVIPATKRHEAPLHAVRRGMERERTVKEHVQRERVTKVMSQPEKQDLQAFARRYVAIWHVADTELRRKGVAQLWAEDGGYANEGGKCRGYAAIEEVVKEAYEEYVARGYIFTSAKVVGHHNVVRLYWEMAAAVGGEVESIGCDFFLLNDDGRIRFDYQFTDIPPSF